ncbi:MAG TPA: MmgE/PrpD family protein, partial [Xanthobacteraceae bacterium]|nr:MmgE/PrpD family protein [Xanthobacteraceae bacterium]
MGETARPQSSAIERLAAWTLAVRAEALPPQSLERAKLLLLDTLGCGFAALGDDVARAVLTTIAAFGEKPQCTVLGQARKLSPPSA